jgi:hypothetical protein
MKRFLLLFALALAGASLFAATRPGADQPYWLAVIALSLAAPALCIAVIAHFRFQRIRQRYARLAEDLEQAVYRLEKRNDLAQTRLTELASAAGPVKLWSPAKASERDYSAEPAYSADAAAVKLERSAKPAKLKTAAREPIRLAREHRAVDHSPRRPIESGPFPLSLQPILEMPGAVPSAYMAFGRLADHDYAADERLPETLDRAEFCEQLIAYATHVSGRLADDNFARTPIVCGLTAEFLADKEKVERLVSAIEAQPSLSNALIFSIPAKMTGSVALQKDALDKIAATGVRFAVVGDVASQKIRKARAKLPLAYILTEAKDFNDDSSLNVLRALVSKAGNESAAVVGLGAETERMQIALLDAGVRHVTSSRAAPARLVKNDLTDGPATAPETTSG